MSTPPDSPTINRDPEAKPTYSKRAGEEPLPGYRLLEPLGHGGFGEVWKCEVPGGLCKAIKFVSGRLDQLEGGASARQELDALQHVKGVRHPFLLSMERVEVIGGELMIIMELADQNLHDHRQSYLAAGNPGIPRPELLAYLLETAEALDLMNFQHGLQHLDIKPRNLFLVSNHVKVADFGLVHGFQELTDSNAARQPTAITPQFAAPEVFKGCISRHSDQYSLAIVYQELLTTTLPFNGRNVRQLMMQHLTAAPNLEPLPGRDRPLVARALAKDPEQRFGSCMEFINALVYASGNLADWLPVDAEGRLGSASSTYDTKSNKSSLALARAALAGAREHGSGSGHTEPHPAPVTRTLPTATPDTVDDATRPATGYQLVECLHQSPLGEIWSMQDGQGFQHLANLLRCEENQTANLLARLRDLRHPRLLPRVVMPDGGGRILVLETLQRRSLRERHKECVTKGLPGIPRQELLGQLEQAALVLDHFARQQLPHLGLHPRCLVLNDDDDEVGLADLGLVALAWLPTQQPAGPLNPRYAAPELDRPGGDGAADQYSLAVIYVEMLTGIHPIRSRGSRSGHGRGTGKPDLDTLAATDRSAVARALDPDPGQRFASCGEFIQSLKRGAEGEANHRGEEFLKLPPVIPTSQLLGGALPEGPTPAAAELAAVVVAAAGGATFNNFWYRLLSNTVIEHQCSVRLFLGSLKLKMQGFHEYWKGNLLNQDQVSFSYRILCRRSLWQKCVGQQPGLEVHLRLEQTADHCQLFLARIRLEAIGGSAGEKLVQEMGPVVLQSLRSFLQVNPEQRAWERWTIDQPLLLYPVLPTGEIGEVLRARGQDISPGDLGFLMEVEPAFKQVYVQLGATPPLADYAVLSRLARCQPCQQGFDVGVVFASGLAPGAA